MSKHIILDTDIGCDCDDTGALALLHSLCDNGEAELLAVTACYSSPYVAGCIDAINTYYGRKVPIGILHDRWQDDAEIPNQYTGYARILCQKFDNDYKSHEGVEDTLTVLRRTLAQAEDNSVTLVVIGTLSSMAKLILSQPDSISPLSGKQLVSQKIERTVVMGGRFTHGFPERLSLEQDGVLAEWNIKCDKQAAQLVCKEWVGELVFCSFEIGFNCITLKTFPQQAGEKNPTAFAYDFYPFVECGRDSWDLTTVLYAVRPNEGYYTLSDWGTVTVTDDAVTEFTKGPGTHAYLLPLKSHAEMETIIDSLVKP